MLHFMGEDSTIGEWPKSKPRRHELMAQIRAIAECSEDVYFSNHAVEQLNLRNYSNWEVISGFQIGDIDGPIRPGQNKSEWVCKVVFPDHEERGSRDIGVITIVIEGTNLFIKTVMWKDHK